MILPSMKNNVNFSTYKNKMYPKSFIISCENVLIVSGPSKICGRSASIRLIRLSSTNFTWSIFEYFVPFPDCKCINKTAPK